MPGNFRQIETSPKPVEHIKYEVTVSESNEKQLVIVAGGVKITLPGHVTPRGDSPVTIDKRSVIISTTAGSYYIYRTPYINTKTHGRFNKEEAELGEEAARTNELVKYNDQYLWSLIRLQSQQVPYSKTQTTPVMSMGGAVDSVT